MNKRTSTYAILALLGVGLLTAAAIELDSSSAEVYRGEEHKPSNLKLGSTRDHKLVPKASPAPVMEQPTPKPAMPDHGKYREQQRTRQHRCDQKLPREIG